MTPRNWRSAGLVVGAQLLSAAVTAKAAAHVMATALRGPICGHGGDHCWACYAALPMLAGAVALTLFERERLRPAVRRAGAWGGRA